MGAIISLIIGIILGVLILKFGFAIIISIFDFILRNILWIILVILIISFIL
jgi:hypothetical protein